MKVLSAPDDGAKFAKQHVVSQSFASQFFAVLAAAVCGLFWLAPAQAVGDSWTPISATGNPPETAEATRGSQQTPTPIEATAEAEMEEEEPSPTTLFFGGDLYYGRSNLEGFKHLRDGFWAAGAGLAYPSTLQLRLATRRGAEAKLAFGVGDFYTDNEATVRQPHEAWYSAPAGGFNLSAGKYYVPFALQEWQYETKWGVMAETERGPYALAVSANYNQNTNSPNAYVRLGRNFGENINVGVSLAAGQGLSYDSIHNRAAGLDATVSWRDWNLYSELLTMRRRSSEKFNFGWLKLEYDGLGKFTPFVAHWRWRDSTDTFGRLRSNAAGASYEIIPTLALEGGYANTSDGNVKWIQLHWTPEWQLWTKGQRDEQRNARVPSSPIMPQAMVPRRKP